MAKINTEKTNAQTYRHDKDLDALLDKAKLSMNSQELLDSQEDADEEAIDKLLRNAGFVNGDDDTFRAEEEPGEFDENAEKTESLASSAVTQDAVEDAQIHEPSSAPLATDADKAAERSDFNTNDLAEQLQEFSDFDEFGEFQEPNEEESSLAGDFADHDLNQQNSTDLLNEYDEFGDDAEDFYTAMTIDPESDDTTATEPKNVDEHADAQIASHAVADFDITIDSEEASYAQNNRAESAKSATLRNRPEEMALPEEAAATLAHLVQFKSEQENLNKDQSALNKKAKKQAEEADGRATKAVRLAYISLAFGLIASIAAGVSGFMAYQAKNELAQWAAANPAALAKKPAAPSQTASVDQNAHSHSIEQKALAMAENQIAESRVKESAAHENSPSSAGQEALLDAAESKSGHEAATPEPVPAPAEPAIAAQATAASETSKAEALNATINESVAAMKDKTAQAVESMPPLSELEQSMGLAPVAPAPVDTPKVKADTKSSNGEAWQKKAAIKKAKAATPPLSWTVNLAAFKDQWSADAKAVEFSDKGVPVEIVPVKKRGQTFYQLRVSGFLDKGEASAYKKRAEKALGVAGVWIGK